MRKNNNKPWTLLAYFMWFWFSVAVVIYVNYEFLFATEKVHVLQIVLLLISIHLQRLLSISFGVRKLHFFFLATTIANWQTYLLVVFCFFFNKYWNLNKRCLTWIVCAQISYAHYAHVHTFHEKKTAAAASKSFGSLSR